jgi:O-antigen/teichoic acid export membrane protein
MRQLLQELRGTGRLTTASVVGFSHAFVAVATLFQSVALARILTLREFGLLVTSLAVAMIAEAAINARGSETALAAFTSSRAKTPDQRLALTRSLMFMDLIWSVCAYAFFLLAVLLYDWLTGNRSTLLYGLMLGGLASFPWGTAKGYITVYLSARKFAPGEFSYAVIAFLAGPILTYFFGVWAFVFGMIIASVLRTGFGFWAIGLNPITVLVPRSGRERLDRREIWWFGLTGTIRSVLVNGLQQFDLILLAAFASPSAVALYRAAKAISSIPQRLAQPIWVLLKRRTIESARRRRRPFGIDPVVLTSALLVLLGVAVAPALMLFADDMMVLLFGAEFGPAGRLLWWLLPAAWLLYGVTGWSSVYGSTTSKRLTVIGIYLLQLLTLLGAAILVGPSMHGIAMATAVSQAFTAIAFWVLYHGRTVKQQPDPDESASRGLG